MAPERRTSGRGFKRFDPGPILEEDSQDGDVEMTLDGDDEQREDAQREEPALTDPLHLLDQERLIIAIDFGTTFSSVAYALLPKGMSTEQIRLKDIKCIGAYPGYEPPLGIPDAREDVPTELWYDTGHRQMPTDDHPMGELEEEGSINLFEDTSSSGDDSDDEASEFDDGDRIEQAWEEFNANRATRVGTQYWGFGVQQRLSATDIPKDEARPLSRFKLKLDEKKETLEVRENLAPILKNLRRKKFIQTDHDIFTHYLTHLLRHTKSQLHLHNALYQDTVVEFVLCVPAKWPAKGCRAMQIALTAAVKEVGLNEYASGSVGNLFMISEPEAAAACVLSEADNEIWFEETIVILDAGGGTVDAVTYQCTSSEPLRLSAEVVPPHSKLCGASYINEKFEKRLMQRLKGEAYLVKNGKTLKSIVEAKSTAFENNEKRKIDTTKPNSRLQPVYIDDLRENQSKRFHQNRMEFNHKETEKLFKKSLKGAQDVLKDQLELAASAKHNVEKVILTGGFGQSKALQSFLKSYLRKTVNNLGGKIDLIIPKNPSTAVARGAVLRALDKQRGPARITQCSYGLLASEPYEPDAFEAHRQTKCRINKVDGEKYVDGTIKWVVQAGEIVQNGKVLTYPVTHVFSLTAKKFLCEEVLWVSDHRHESHYRRTHTLNKAAEKAGTIIADMTFLKTEGHIQPQPPSELSGSKKGYWEVPYEVVMIFEGRSLRFLARWPREEDLRPGQRQEVLARDQICVAAAFQPGTA